MTTRSFKMRKEVVAMAICLAVVAMVSGCIKPNDDPNNPGNFFPDPEGTITVNTTAGISIQIDYVVNGKAYSSGLIYWGRPDNIVLHSGYNGVDHSICNIGKMNGLGNITKIPSSGFSQPISYTSNTTACEVGHGYVVKMHIKRDNSWGLPEKIIYVRLFVVESIVNTSGGIMGAKVKYQYPFEP